MQVRATDAEAKAYFSNAERFADAFNFLIYDGRQVIRAEALREMDAAAIALPYGNGARQPTQKFRDVLRLYSAMRDGRAIYLVLGIEIQEATHYAMPVRNMLYDAMNYAQQVASIAAAHRKARTRMAREEFLSGFRKDDKLMPVITLVVSFSADAWDGPTRLHEMLEVEDRELLAFVPDYRLNLLSPAQICDADFDKFRTELGAVLQCVKHRNDETMDWLAGNKRFESIGRDTASLIRAVTGADIQIDEKEERVNMWAAWESSMDEARMAGIAEGKAEGRAEGRVEGKADGENNMMEAIRMIKADSPVEAIRKKTGLTSQRLAELRAMLL